MDFLITVFTKVQMGALAGLFLIVVCQIIQRFLVCSFQEQRFSPELVPEECL